MKFDYNTLHYDTLKKSSDFISGAKTDVAIGFVPFSGAVRQLGKVRINFFSECKLLIIPSEENTSFIKKTDKETN